MGCAQISRIKELIAKKQYILKYYKEALKKFEILNLNPEKVNVSMEHGCQQLFFLKKVE